MAFGLRYVGNLLERCIPSDWDIQPEVKEVYRKITGIIQQANETTQQITNIAMGAFEQLRKSIASVMIWTETVSDWTPFLPRNDYTFSEVFKEMTRFVPDPLQLLRAQAPRGYEVRRLSFLLQEGEWPDIFESYRTNIDDLALDALLGFYFGYFSPEEFSTLTFAWSLKSQFPFVDIQTHLILDSSGEVNPLARDFIAQTMLRTGKFKNSEPLFFSHSSLDIFLKGIPKQEALFFTIKMEPSESESPTMSEAPARYETKNRSISDWVREEYGLQPLHQFEYQGNKYWMIPSFTLMDDLLYHNEMELGGEAVTIVPRIGRPPSYEREAFIKRNIEEKTYGMALPFPGIRYADKKQISEFATPYCFQLVFSDFFYAIMASRCSSLHKQGLLSFVEAVEKLPYTGIDPFISIWKKHLLAMDSINYQYPSNDFGVFLLFVIQNSLYRTIEDLRLNSSEGNEKSVVYILDNLESLLPELASILHDRSFCSKFGITHYDLGQLYQNYLLNKATKDSIIKPLVERVRKKDSSKAAEYYDYVSRSTSKLEISRELLILMNERLRKQDLSSYSFEEMTRGIPNIHELLERNDYQMWDLVSFLKGGKWENLIEAYAGHIDDLMTDALIACKRKLITPEQLSTLAFRWSLEKEEPKQQPLTFDLFDVVSGQINPIAKELITQTLAWSGQCKDKGKPETLLMGESLINFFYAMRGQPRSERAFFLVPTARYNPSTNLEEIMAANPKDQWSISDSTYYQMGINLLYYVIYEGEAYCMIPSFSMMQQAHIANGQVQFGDVVQLLPYFGGASPLSRLVMNGQTDTRDVAIPFPGVPFPKYANQYQVKQPRNFVHHDAIYHAYIAGRIPSIFRKAAITLSLIVNRESVCHDPDTMSYRFLKVLFERTIDMEYTYFRPDFIGTIYMKFLETIRYLPYHALIRSFNSPMERIMVQYEIISKNLIKKIAKVLEANSFCTQFGITYGDLKRFHIQEKQFQADTLRKIESYEADPTTIPPDLRREIDIFNTEVLAPPGTSSESLYLAMRKRLDVVEADELSLPTQLLHLRPPKSNVPRLRSTGTGCLKPLKNVSIVKEATDSKSMMLLFTNNVGIASFQMAHLLTLS